MVAPPVNPAGPGTDRRIPGLEGQIAMTKTALIESAVEIKEQLAALSEDTASLLALARHQLEKIDAALARLGGVTPRGRTVDLADVPLHDLVDQVIAQRGERSAAWLRTRLHQHLERRTGRRQRGGGQDRIVATNGHAGNGVVSHLS
jgi:hypothetical protein